MKHLVLCMILVGCASYDGVNQAYEQRRKNIEEQYIENMRKNEIAVSESMLPEIDDSILLSEEFRQQAIDCFKKYQQLGNCSFSNQYLEKLYAKHTLADVEKAKLNLRLSEDGMRSKMTSQDRNFIAQQSRKVFERLWAGVSMEAALRMAHNQAVNEYRTNSEAMLDQWRREQLSATYNDEIRSIEAIHRINQNTAASIGNSLGNMQRSLEQQRRDGQMDLMLHNQQRQINQMNQLLWQQQGR